MRREINISLTSEDCNRLVVIVGDRNAAQKRVWCASIILFGAGRGRDEPEHALNRQIED